MTDSANTVYSKTAEVMSGAAQALNTSLGIAQSEKAREAEMDGAHKANLELQAATLGTKPLADASTDAARHIDRGHADAQVESKRSEARK